MRLLHEVASVLAKLPLLDDPTFLLLLVRLLLLLLLLLPRLKDPLGFLKDEVTRADVEAVTPAATSAPFTTDFLKFRGLRVGLCVAVATKNIGQNIMSRSDRKMIKAARGRCSIVKHAKKKYLNAQQ